MPHTSPGLLLSVCGSAVIFFAGLPLPLQADNWPQWRGPDGNGVSRETDLPVAWSEASGVVWKCPLPQWGNSTPAIWGDAVFLTSHVDDHDLLLLKINKQTGRIEWTRQVGTGSCLRGEPGSYRGRQKFHRDHNLATPSPVTDGRLVVVHFGNGDLAAYDFAGKQLWKRNLQEDYGRYTIWWGHANSPVLYKDLVISVCMQDSCSDIQDQPAPSYVVAHDKQTGRQVWKTMRMTDATRESCDAYTTPIFRRSGNRPEMVVMGGQMLDAYDPAAGKRLWYLPGLTGNRLIPSPVAAGEMIYATQGMREALLAVKPGGDGQRPRKDVVWQFDQGTSDSPTPVVAGEWLFTVTNNGVARCLDAHTGRVWWKERLRGEYRASPLAAEGRVYFLNMDGLTTVVSASPRYDRLTENHLDDRTIATPVTSDGKIFIRGRKWLYCLSR
jgi:outer membrane protein assembly factor BamB